MAASVDVHLTLSVKSMPGACEMEIVGAELREVAKGVTDVRKLEFFALHFASAVGNRRESINLNNFIRWTVICD